MPTLEHCDRCKRLTWQIKGCPCTKFTLHHENLEEEGLEVWASDSDAAIESYCEDAFSDMSATDIYADIVVIDHRRKKKITTNVTADYAVEYYISEKKEEEHDCS